MKSLSLRSVYQSQAEIRSIHEHLRQRQQQQAQQKRIKKKKAR